MSEAEKDFPPDMECLILLDATRFINQSLAKISKTFFEALLLVMIIVWLFLKDFRATLIALLAIPVSIVATFAVFPLVGFTINTLTLFALILAIGLVVDDAIVVIEIVERKLERGMEIKEATLKAMQEIQAPIIAIACVLAAVFIPAAFMAGITGELYRQFALIIVASMIFSTVVALSLTPVLCVLFFRRREKIFSAIFDRFKVGFKSLLEILMLRKVFAVLILAMVMVGALLAEVVTRNLASVYMHIGILVLIGLAAKNAILIVEVAKVKVERGEEPTRAVIDAATERLRSILMTSLAFVMACIPLAAASGAGSAARNCMGAAIVGGMIFTTLLGIFLVPIFFTLIEQWKTGERGF